MTSKELISRFRLSTMQYIFLKELPWFPKTLTGTKVITSKTQTIAQTGYDNLLHPIYPCAMHFPQCGAFLRVYLGLVNPHVNLSKKHRNADYQCVNRKWQLNLGKSSINDVTVLEGDGVKDFVMRVLKP